MSSPLSPCPECGGDEEGGQLAFVEQRREGAVYINGCIKCICGYSGEMNEDETTPKWREFLARSNWNKARLAEKKAERS